MGLALMGERQGPSARLVRAMPWIFVLIWSTGFVVARYGMPHSPPLTFLTLRYALSLVCFGAWIAWARPPWPQDRAQWAHLCVVGMLIHAGYLGGVWAAVKAGIGAGTVALLVGLQPVLTALWLSLYGARRDAHGARVSAVQWLGLALGLGGLTLVVWHKLGGGEITAWNLALAVFALFSITTGTLYQKRFIKPCDVRTAAAIQLAAAFIVSLPLAWLETEPVVWHSQMIGAMACFVLNDALVKHVSESMASAQLIFLRGLMASALVLLVAHRLGALRQASALLHPRVALRAAVDACATVLHLLALFRLHQGQV